MTATVPDLATLTPMRVAERLPRLRVAVAAAEAPVDALAVTTPANVRYLTGFTGSAGVVLVLPDEVVLLTDGRYATQAVEQLAAAGVDATVEVARAVDQAERAATVTSGCRGTIGLEAGHVPWARAREMTERWFAHLEVVPTVGLVEGLRRVKDDGEVDRLAAAAAIADAALAEVRPMLAERPTERQVAALLDHTMRALGATGPSFETIVAAGTNAAMPHHRPDDTVVEPGVAVVVDFGALVDGYCSDMTRTVWVGELADPAVMRAVQVVHAAQAAGAAAVADGVGAADVDGAARRVVADAGWAEQFVHGTGHGVGLDIHEAPSVAATSTDMLRAGHVVTVEPGVYLPGVGGVRIEDTVVVTATGCRPITLTEKDLP